ncbi:MAG: hypothetical protein ACOC8A_00295 [bacterium]
MRRVVVSLALLILGLSAAGGEKPVLAILNFESPDEGKLGQKVARRLNRRAMEANTHILFDRDDLRMATEQAKLDVSCEGQEQAIQAFAREQLGADLVIWGKAEPLPDRGFHVRVRCMSTQGEATPYLDVARKCANFAALANFYTDFEPILLRQRKTLRTLEPVDEKARARNLVPNSSFEEGTWYPAHWTKVDGLTSHWLDREDGKGKCLMMDTDVDEQQALDWMKKVRSGKATAKEAPEKIASTKETIYGTIGAWEGVQIYSDFLPVTPKMRYRLTVDIQGPWGGIFFPKAFVKGYAERSDEFTTQKRELYRMYLALRTETKGKEWETFSRTFNPTLRSPDVKWMRVMLYAYWPLGKYYWDNIVLTEEAVED